jgi:hypothetical protein
MACPDLNDEDYVEGDIIDAGAVAGAVSTGVDTAPGVAVLATDGVGGVEEVPPGAAGVGGGVAAFG